MCLAYQVLAINGIRTYPKMGNDGIRTSNIDQISGKKRQENLRLFADQARFS